MEWLKSRYVWVERGAVWVVTLAASFGWADSTQESIVAAGGIAGAVTFIQVLGVIYTHVRTLEHHVSMSAAQAAADAGKAPVHDSASNV